MKGLFWNWLPLVSADDRNEVARRALVQILAIRAWQLKHGGQFPDHLEALVPDELASLPKDPYSDHSFRFVADEGLWPPPLRTAAFVESNTLGRPSDLAKPPPGSRFLVSVGHDQTSANVRIVFAIPPVEGSPGSAKTRATRPRLTDPAPPLPSNVLDSARLEARSPPGRSVPPGPSTRTLTMPPRQETWWAVSFVRPSFSAQ